MSMYVKTSSSYVFINIKKNKLQKNAQKQNTFDENMRTKEILKLN